MRFKMLIALAFLMFFTLLQRKVDAGSKKVIIHVPYHVKNIKHTHTIYKIIKHKHEAKHENDDWKKAAEEEMQENFGPYYK